MNKTERQKWDWIQQLHNIDACTEAAEWCNTMPDKQAAWDACDRGDWMLWLPARYTGSPRSQSRRALVLIVCQCARLALPLVPDTEPRPLAAIDTAERWAGDKSVTLDDVRAAADAAYAAADAADAAYAAYAAYAAAYAAADAFAFAAYAADAADAASGAFAAAADARDSVLSQCADIVREYAPSYPSRSIGHWSRTHK